MPSKSAANDDESDGALSHSQGALLVLVVATAIFLWLAFLLVQPFLGPLAWALALAVVGAPLHKWICRRSRNPNAGAAIAVIIVACIIVAPVCSSHNISARDNHDRSEAAGTGRPANDVAFRRANVTRVEARLQWAERSRPATS